MVPSGAFTLVISSTLACQGGCFAPVTLASSSRRLASRHERNDGADTYPEPTVAASKQ
jgi:hypothetical protein